MLGNGTFQCLQTMIDGITFQQIVFQDLIGPLEEAGTLFTLYPITDLYDYIQIIVVYLIDFIIRSSIGKFCPNWIPE